MPTTAKVHPCLPDGWLMDAPYRAYSNTRHRGPTETETDTDDTLIMLNMPWL